jgi:hypothetical protein
MELDIKKIGNVPEVKLESRFLKNGLIETDHVAVKAYYMHSDEKKCNENSVIRFANLEREILEKKLKSTQCGIGFAIISEMDKVRTLYNINMWGEKIPLLFPTLFMELIPHHTFKNVSVDEEGSLCMYEMQIANYETGEWAKYLNTKRTTADKEAYLHNFAPAGILRKI